MQELQLLGEDEFPLTRGRLVNSAPPVNAALRQLPVGDAITVNTVHGNDVTIAAAVERYNPHVESMEGAAFMYSCLVHGVPLCAGACRFEHRRAAQPRRMEAAGGDRRARHDAVDHDRLRRSCERIMKLTLAFSPCPNDCFIFDAMVHGRIDLEGLEFDVRLADVEALNTAAFDGEVDITQAEFSRLRVLRRSLRAARRRQCARP